jgi:membrane-associated phospholipid phosphatase
VVLPVALLLIRGVRSGRWSDADVSVPKERASFYPPAILLSLGGVIALVLIGAPGFIFRGALITLVLLLLAAGINRVVKISLHTMFAFYCAVILVRIGILPGGIALILASLVFWSRLHLRRHTIGEVLLGAGLGTLGAVVTAWLP